MGEIQNLMFLKGIWRQMDDTPRYRHARNGAPDS